MKLECQNCHEKVDQSFTKLVKGKRVCLACLEYCYINFDAI